MTAFELTPQERFLTGVRLVDGCVVLRASWSRRLGPCVSGALGAFFLAGGISDDSILGILAGVAIEVLVAWLFVVRWRGLVRATPQHVLVRGIARSRVLPWADVVAVRCAEVAPDVQLARHGRWWREGKGDLVLCVDTADGHSVTAPAISSAGGFGVGIRTAAETKAALVERYGVTVAGWRPRG